MARTLITGGAVLRPGGLRQLDILIEDEKILDLLDSVHEPVDANVIEATDLIILPGVIDGHTHFIPHDPDSDHPRDVDDEGFFHGGRGAAAGGVTTIVEMPQAYPPTINGAAFERKHSIAGLMAIVDFAMWGGVTPGENLKSWIDEQAESGAVAFKGYMCNDDPDLPLLNDSDILLVLKTLEDANIMLGLHTENEKLLRYHLDQVRATSRTDPRAHADSRPPILEATDVQRAIQLAEESGGWVHIVHMNSIESAALVKRAKERGIRITAETCPHYLSLDLQDLEQLGPYAKCVPALRSREEVEELWTYLADGTIDCVASDHCGWTSAAKDAGVVDIWNAPNGLTGVQTLLPVMITEARQRGFSWEDIANWTATMPAQLWRLDGKKGSIQVGADADFALIDPNFEWTLAAEDLLHAQKWSPFEGRTFQGKVIKSILRGEVIFDLEQQDPITIEPGFGQFLKPQ